jgi:hypothetical protein
LVSRVNRRMCIRILQVLALDVSWSKLAIRPISG